MDKTCLMGEIMADFATWFGLNDGRDNFVVQTNVDYALFFARESIDITIRQLIHEANLTRIPLKMVIYGDWGCGKTHTLKHLKYLLENNSPPGIKGFPVLIDLSDVMAKTRFNEAQSFLLDAIGLPKICDWVRQYNARYPNAGQRIKDFTSSSDVEKAFLTLLTYGESSQIAWQWLRGQTLSASESRAIGLPASLNQSNTLVLVLRVLGIMCLEFDERKLIFLIDEADTLKAVSDKDSINHWKQCLKNLADISNQECGIIIAAAFLGIEDMPEMLSDQQIVTRFGENHFVSLHTFNKEEAKIFIRCLFAEWIDGAKRTGLMSLHSAEADGEQLGADTFPFTDDGLEKFCEWITRNGLYTRPRVIQTDLTAILTRAIDESRHVLSSVFITQITS